MRFDSRGLVSTYLSQWMPLGDTTRQGVAGYQGARYNDSNRLDITKLSFSTETASNIGNVSVNASGYCGFANSGVAGYLGGNNTLNGNKVAFPSDTISVLTPIAIGSKYGVAAFSNTAVAGYQCGGQEASQTDTIAKVAFPSDAVSASATTLASVNYYSCGSSNYGVAGYTFGGAFNNTQVNKIAFPSDTRTTITTLSATSYPSCFANSGSAAYVNINNAGYSATIETYAFPSDVKTTYSATLSVARWQMGGFCNIGIAGYFCGGAATAGFSDVYDRFDMVSNVRTTLVAVLTTSGTSASGAFADCGVL